MWRSAQSYPVILFTLYIKTPYAVIQLSWYISPRYTLAAMREKTRTGFVRTYATTMRCESEGCREDAGRMQGGCREDAGRMQGGG